uniref:Uncharacterized protein n=1 Tax=Megaselia scalaris TaxID=36166 RepID=T1GDX6_MEGSC
MLLSFILRIHITGPVGSVGGTIKFLFSSIYGSIEGDFGGHQSIYCQNNSSVDFNSYFVIGCNFQPLANKVFDYRDVIGTHGDDWLYCGELRVESMYIVLAPFTCRPTDSAARSKCRKKLQENVLTYRNPLIQEPLNYYPVFVSEIQIVLRRPGKVNIS